MVLGLYQVILYRWSSSGLQNINSVERSYQLENTYNSPVKILIAFFVAESIKSFLSSEVVDWSFFSFIKKISYSKTANLPLYQLYVQFMLKYVRVRMYTRVCARSCMCTRERTRVCTCTCMHMHAYVRVRTRVRVLEDNFYIS